MGPSVPDRMGTCEEDGVTTLLDKAERSHYGCVESCQCFLPQDKS